MKNIAERLAQEANAYFVIRTARRDALQLPLVQRARAKEEALQVCIAQRSAGIHKSAPLLLPSAAGFHPLNPENALWNSRSARNILTR